MPNPKPATAHVKEFAFEHLGRFRQLDAEHARGLQPLLFALPVIGAGGLSFVVQAVSTRMWRTHLPDLPWPAAVGPFLLRKQDKSQATQ